MGQTDVGKVVGTTACIPPQLHQSLQDFRLDCFGDWDMGRMQENASKRDDVPPSQGGKYVGFGSGPPPAGPRRGGQPGGIDDVSVALSKGFSQLSTVAGRASGIPSFGSDAFKSDTLEISTP